MSQEKPRVVRTSWRWLAAICVLAVACSAVAEAAHFHSGSRQDSAKTCPLCVKAHSSTALPSANVQQVAPAAASAKLAAKPATAGHSRLEKGVYFVRPPPAV